MQIILGSYGFCEGVSRAIEIARKTAKTYGKVFTIHPIIHNMIVTKNLQNEGIIPIDDYCNLPQDGVLILSAHGVGKNDIEYCKKHGIKYVDCTCPYVKSIHNKVAEYDAKGYQIVIIGDKSHIEVKGTGGWCHNPIFISAVDDIHSLDKEKYFVVVQTTFPMDLYKNIKNKIIELSKKSLKTVEFFDSICYTTVDRQEEAHRIASQCDCILVVGDKMSKNSQNLFALAHNDCANVYFIEGISDLKSVDINKKNIAKLGIISGASTPKELTMEVFNRMSDETSKVGGIEDITTTAEATVVDATEEKNQELSFAQLMNETKKYSGKSYKEGLKLKATVMSVDNSGINVAVDNVGKNDSGFIPRDEVELDGSFDPANYKEGDKLDVIIIPRPVADKNNKSINLSKKAYDAIKADDEYVKKILAGEEFSMACTQEIKGGLLGKIGTYTIFVPASQIRVGFVKSLAEYVGKTLRLKALPPKEELDEEGNVKKPRNAKRIVASQRVILEAEKEVRENEFWAKVYEGAIVSGKVKRFTNFGAFVSLKLMDGLVHNSDLSWSKKRITDPGEVLEINKSYDFLVLSVDKEANKISLGYKQLQKRPVEIAQEKFPIGSTVKGKVARLVKFGAFIELEPGIDGLVHISQINRGWIQNASEALKEGDEVDVKIMGYEDDKITLSIKELLPELPVVEEKEEAEAPTQSASKPSRTSTFNKRLEGAEKPERKERKRKDKDENSDEPREYMSSGSGVTLGDIFNFMSSDNK